jgi:hypothetical protein
MKTRKIFLRVLLVLLVLVTGVLLIRAVFNYRMGNKLEDYFGERQAEGVALSKGVLFPDCPEEHNAANLWKAAEALFSREGINADVLRKAMESIFHGEPLEPDVREELTKMIDKNRRVLQFMEEASDKPCFRYGDQRQKFYNMRIPDAVKMIQAVRLLSIDAVFKAEEGKIEEAIEQVRQGLAFVQKTMDEPTLITTLVAIANMKFLLFSLNDILCGGEIDSETLHILIQDLDQELWRKKFVRGIQGERVFFLENALEVLGGNKDIFNPNLGESLFFWFIRPLTKAEILWGLKKFDEIESRAALPFFQTREFWTQYDQEVNSIPWYRFVSKNLLAHFSSIALKEATLEAVMGTGQIALACKIYKNRKGHFPEDVAALVPDILDELPIDAFTGKPYVYKIQEDGLIIYSFGSNEKDDQGRGTLQFTQLVMEKDDDWTWRELKNRP